VGAIEEVRERPHKFTRGADRKTSAGLPPLGVLILWREYARDLLFEKLRDLVDARVKLFPRNRVRLQGGGHLLDALEGRQLPSEIGKIRCARRQYQNDGDASCGEPVCEPPPDLAADLPAR